MTPKKPSVSKSSLINSGCTAWLHPAADWDDAPGPAATKGTIVHKLIENDMRTSYLNDQTEREYSDYERSLIDEFVVPAAMFVDNLVTPIDLAEGMPDIHVEIGFCYHKKTGAVLVVNGREEYPDGSDWFCGTADLVIVGDKDTYVLDWKTGNPWKAKEQLTNLAYLAADTFGSDSVTFMSVGFENRKAFAAINTRITKADAEAYFRKTIDNLYASPGKPTIGDHCYDLYCPHRFSCQAITDQYNAIDYSASDPPGAHRLLVASKLMAKRVELMKANAEEYIRKNGGIAVEGGWLTETYKNQSSYPVDSLKQLVYKLGGTAEDIQSCQKQSRISNGFRVQKLDPKK